MRNIIADVGVTFYHGGLEYVGTRGALVSASNLQTGGFLEEPDLSLTINLEDEDGDDVFTTEPVVGDQITIGSSTYRIEKTHRDEFASALQMDLTTTHK